MSAGRDGIEQAEVGTGDTTDSSSSSDEEMFPTNLEDVNSGDRTFNSILSLLVGRQSVSQTLRLLRQEVRTPGEEDTESSSDDDSSGHYWHFHPRPSPATHHPPDTGALEQAEIAGIVRSSTGHRPGRRQHRGTFEQILRGPVHGGLSVKEQRSILSSSRLLPHSCETVANYNKKVFCGTHARDGDLFITACPDKIRLYDTRDHGFSLLQTIEPRDVGWSVLDVGVSLDGRQLVYSSWSDSLHFVAIGDDPSDDSGSQHYNLQLVPGDPGQFCVFSVKFSRDSREILGGANDGCLYVYDREINKQTSRIQAHKDDINAVSFLDDSTHLLASGGDDGLVMVWDRRSLRQDAPVPVGVLAGHSDGLTFIDPKMDGRHIISNSKDQSIKLWDIRRFSSQTAIDESKNVISNQKWDYRWQRVPRHVAKLRTQVEGDSSLMTYTGHTILQTLIRCHFSPAHTTGQSLIYTGCAAGRVVIYDILTGEIVKILSGHKGCVRDVSWHPHSQEIISSSWDFSVKRWSGVEKVVEDDERESRLKEKSNTSKTDKNLRPDKKRKTE